MSCSRKLRTSSRELAPGLPVSRNTTQRDGGFALPLQGADWTFSSSERPLLKRAKEKRSRRGVMRFRLFRVRLRGVEHESIVPV